MKYLAVGKPSVLKNNYLATRLKDLSAEVFETDSTNPRSTIDELVVKASSDGIPILAVGGDGMVNDVLDSVVKFECDVVVGVIACGSGNAAYWNFGLKKSSWILPFENTRVDDSIDAIVRGRTERRDLLCLGIGEEKRYATWMSVGYSADVVKQRLNDGTTGYVLPALRTLRDKFSYHFFKIRPTIDIIGSQESTVEPLLAVFSPHKIEYFGKGIRIADKGSPGMVGVTVYDQHPVTAALALCGTVAGRLAAETRLSGSFAVKNSVANVEYDGEFLGGVYGKTIRVGCAPDAVEMIVG